MEDKVLERYKSTEEKEEGWSKKKFSHKNYQRRKRINL